MRGFATRCCDGYDVEVATTCAGRPPHAGATSCRRASSARATSRSAGSRSPSAVAHARARRVELPRPGAGAGGVGLVGADAALPGRRRIASTRSCWRRTCSGRTFWSAAAQPARALLGAGASTTSAEARTAPMRALLGPRLRLHLPLPRRGGSRRARLAPVRASRVVGVGVDVAPPLDHARAAEIRASLGLERPYVVSVGRVEEGKRVDALVDLMARLPPPRTATLDLVLAGSGPYGRPAGCGGSGSSTTRRSAPSWPGPSRRCRRRAMESSRWCSSRPGARGRRRCPTPPAARWRSTRARAAAASSTAAPARSRPACRRCSSPGARERFGAAGASVRAGAVQLGRRPRAVPHRRRGARMRVVIDATPLALPPTGIGTYLRDTIAACGRTPRGHEIVALSMGGRSETAGLASTSTRRPASCAAPAGARLVRAARGSSTRRRSRCWSRSRAAPAHSWARSGSTRASALACAVRSSTTSCRCAFPSGRRPRRRRCTAASWPT